MRPRGRNYAAARRLPRGAPDRPPRGPGDGRDGSCGWLRTRRPRMPRARDASSSITAAVVALMGIALVAGGALAGRARRLALLHHRRCPAAGDGVAAMGAPRHRVMGLCGAAARHHGLGTVGGRPGFLVAGATRRRAGAARHLAAVALHHRPSCCWHARGTLEPGRRARVCSRPSCSVCPCAAIALG